MGRDGNNLENPENAPPPQLSRPYTHASHSGMSLCSRVGARKKFLVGEMCPPVDLKYIHFVKNRLVTGHGEHYSNLKSAGTS